MVRLKQANLIGPAGFISMEDGCVGGFVQRGIAGASRRARRARDGRVDGGEQREPRQRGLDPRLLEAIPPVHGAVSA